MRGFMDLIEAVINNDVAKVKELLANGADPNLTLDKAQITPLHFAAQRNCLEVVPPLIAAGANLNARIKPDDHTPLDVARMHDHREMVALLTFYAKAK